MLLLLAARNAEGQSAIVSKLLGRRATAASPPAKFLWPERWAEGGGGKRARPSYKSKRDDFVDSEEEDEDEEANLMRNAEKFVPFGQVVAASGCSVRATTSCAAGLAAELPLWGLQLKGDQSWRVRALRPPWRAPLPQPPARVRLLP